MAKTPFWETKKGVIDFISKWIERSTPFKVKKIELEKNPKSIWKLEVLTESNFPTKPSTP